MDKLVSMLILSYRNIDGIYETVDSVLKQDYSRIEIVISDDGTPEFEKHKPKIMAYINERKKTNIERVYVNDIKVNGGTVKNINSGIRCCNGDYIKVLSAEDTLGPDHALSIYVDFMEQNDYLIAFAKMRGVMPDGTVKNELLACESDYDALRKLSTMQTANRLFARNFLPAPAWMIRRELFEKYGLFQEKTRLIEDYPYWIYLSLKGVRFGYIDDVLIDYKLSGESSGGSYGKLFMQDMFTIYENYIFPYDRRYGILQKPYNRIKKSGLNFYMTKAKWPELSTFQKLWARIKYCHFYLYVGWLDVSVKRKNKKSESR